MTTPRNAYIEWQTWPESRRQRVSDWYDDLLALQSLLGLRLGLRHTGGSVFAVLLFNAWDTDGPWIPPGRLDLAGEYLEAKLRGVTGSEQADLLASVSVPTSEATTHERELAGDIRTILEARARWLMSA
jgi:hypothetical protein